MWNFFISTLKFCVRGSTENRNEGAFFIVESVGYYLKDTYDFIDDGYPEPLGIWSKDRILSKAESSVYIYHLICQGAGGVWPANFQGLFRCLMKIFENGRKNIKLEGTTLFSLTCTGLSHYLTKR